MKIGLCIGLSEVETVAEKSGSPTPMRYTLIGDAANVGARPVPARSPAR